ncbi:MAG: CoA activase [Deltaproteobacteria bacterium]|nr:CoA activase [Deltaproteobacteria bacterium]
MESKTERNEDKVFKLSLESVGKFQLGKRIVLIPEMNRIAAYLFASTFKSFGIDARVLETFKGMDLGIEYTSGKECYPCQVTMGDILYFAKKEKERLGDAFKPENYVYFLPESDGPCRYGMYNKYQRIVLDSFPGLDKLKIFSLTTKDGYSVDGMIPSEQILDFKKAGYFSLLIADLMDRLLWRIRPYEKKPGMADEFIERAMRVMGQCFEAYGQSLEFDRILSRLEEIIGEGNTIIDPEVPQKPLIGIVGEIFLRMHCGSNQDLIRTLERHGAEVVNASLCEWVNYASYEPLREARENFRLNLKSLRLGHLKTYIKDMMRYGLDLFYKEHKQKQVYKRVQPLLNLADDHKISHLEKILKEDDIFSFDVGTEACLSISAIIQYAREGYNGIVNVYPFTCMPSTTTSAVVRPLMNRLGVPYLDTPYDASIQPGREAAIRTFMYQAYQHYKRHGRKV